MARGSRWNSSNLAATAFISLVILAGSGVLVYGATHLASANIAEFICYLLITILASRLRVNLPAMADTLSVNFLFVLVGVLDLSFTETVMLAAAGVVIQSFSGDRQRPLRVAFNICSCVVATALAYGTYHQIIAPYAHPQMRPFLLAMAASVYFAANAVAVAGMICLTEDRSFNQI